MSEPFAPRLLRWFDAHGRKDLPWQHPREPYRVWLSEIMLQQTQVATVIPYFHRFLERFPDLQSLAEAPVDDVLQRWAGLGYYARARNLHRCAQVLVERHGGHWPRDIEALVALPGIGRSTAAAILAQAYGDRHAILDGNVKRVLARHAGIDGWPGLPAVQQKLWAISESHLPDTRLADYTQAIMDLGAQLCRGRKPDCGACPVAADCVAHRDGRVHALPASKPARARPRKQAWLLLVEDLQGRVLLERRAPAGIWGGLWCPPVIERTAGADDDEADGWSDVLDARFRLTATPIETLAPVQHAFSHYDLELLPLRLCASAPDAISDGATAWTTMHDPAALPGLPAPVRKLVEAVYFRSADLLSPC